MSLRVLPSEGTSSVFLALRMEQEVGGPRIFRLELDAAGGRLVAELDREKPATRAEVASRLTAGREVRLALTHVDDQVMVSVDGVEGSPRFAYRPAVLGLKKDSAVDVTFGAEGTGEVAFSHLRIDRDFHMRSGGIAENQRTVDVPPGHYWMLGDNTLASEDGRAWTEISFKVNERGDILPPGDPAPHPVLRGNRRPIRTTDPMDPDENPVISTVAKKVVFTDWLGEEHTFPWNGKEWGPEIPKEALLRPVSSCTPGTCDRPCAARVLATQSPRSVPVRLREVRPTFPEFSTMTSGARRGRPSGDCPPAADPTPSLASALGLFPGRPPAQPSQGTGRAGIPGFIQATRDLDVRCVSRHPRAGSHDVARGPRGKPLSTRSPQ